MSIAGLLPPPAAATAGRGRRLHPVRAEYRDPRGLPGGVPLTDEHVLAPGDEIEIRFPFYADLNDRVVVGPDGALSLQLVNTVVVGGLTVGAATKLLNEATPRSIKTPA